MVKKASSTRPYLCAYNYGMGFAFLYVIAESWEDIRDKFPNLELVDPIPSHISDESLQVIAEKLTFDIDSPVGVLRDIQEAGRRKRK